MLGAAVVGIAAGVDIPNAVIPGVFPKMRGVGNDVGLGMCGSLRVPLINGSASRYVGAMEERWYRAPVSVAIKAEPALLGTRFMMPLCWFLCQRGKCADGVDAALLACFGKPKP